MSSISIENFLKIEKSNLQVIDIREKYEYDNGHIESLHIPMDEILHSIHRIDTDRKVVIYCQSGRRAAATVYMLKKKHNFDNIFNLAGGYSDYIAFTLKSTI